MSSKKIRRGPKLEGYAFANFGYSSETDGESLLRIKNRVVTKSTHYCQRRHKFKRGKNRPSMEVKGVTKFTQYCQRRHKFERRNRPRREV